MEQTNRRGFSLLEFMVVIAILALLSVMGILIFNPSEKMKRARDDQRIADLDSLKNAILLYVSNTSTPLLGAGDNGWLGCTPSGFKSSHFIWYSSATVEGRADRGGTVIPAASSTASAVDGSGWIPINFTSLEGGSPLVSLPVDPVNTVVTPDSPNTDDLVYRYGCNMMKPDAPQFEIDARFESHAYTISDNKHYSDEGNNADLYEVGNALNVLGSGNL